MLEKVGNEFLPLRGHPVDGNRRRNGGGVVRSGGLAGAPLVPLDDGEIILPRALIQPVDRHLGGSGTTVNEQQHRVPSVAAAPRDPLLDPADFDRETYFTDRKRVR